jgi:hypothetical protein
MAARDPEGIQERRAMPVDPVANRRFIESLSTLLEDHLASWKSQLADTRNEVNELISKAYENIPAQGKGLFPEDLVAALLEDAVPPTPAPERVVEKVVEKVVETVTVTVPGPPTPPDWGLVKASISAIEGARTQVDVLTRFLSEAQVHSSRAALLVLRNDHLTGWKALGFDASGGRDDSVKGLDLAVGDDPFVAACLKAEKPMLAAPPAEDSPLRRALGGHAPARTLLVPMVIRDRLAGLICADELPGEEGRLNEAAVEVLTFVTGLSVDLLAARKKIPSPALTPRGEEIALFTPAGAAGVVDDDVPFAQAPAPPPAPSLPPVSAASIAPRPASPQEAPPVSASLPVPSEQAVRSLFEQTDPSGARKTRRITDAGEALRALEESAGPKKVGSLSGIDLLSSSGARSAAALGVPQVPRPTTPTPVPVPSPRIPPPAPPRDEERPEPPPSRGDLTMAFDQIKTSLATPPPASPSVQAPPPPAPAQVPAPAAAPVAPPPAGGSDSPLPPGAPLAPPPGFVPRGRAMRGADDPQRAVDDARRIARLLVSEIKLYNERKVAEGRAAGDLYERLRDDIERSRQVYAERTPEHVRATSDFFHEELVRILGEGKPEALGPVPS